MLSGRRKTFFDGSQLCFACVAGDTGAKTHREAAHNWAIRFGVHAAKAGIDGLRAAALNNPRTF